MTCRPGAEGALKTEVARGEPDWHPAFSRPAFVTFKCPESKPLDLRQLAERQWVFAHSHGVSLGRLKGSELSSLAAQMWQLEAVRLLVAGQPLSDIHVWQRDVEIDDNSLESVGVTPLAIDIERAIRLSAPASCPKILAMPSQRRATHRNGHVLDVVVIEPNVWCIGHHCAVTLPQRWPGGAIPVAIPNHAVSRAYAKMEEALDWSGLPVAAGDECVELGCAPGGASQALLDRGLFVTGIDPAEVDPALIAHPRFRHLRQRSKEVRRSEFTGVRWLAADMNLAPNYTLDAVDAIVNHRTAAVRGLILTLKLSDWNAATALPALAARVHDWGYRDVRMRQLSTGGQEVCLVALRRKALRRIGRKRKRSRTSGATDAHPALEKRLDPPQTTLSGPHF